jgi:predicted aspartyl protease
MLVDYDLEFNYREVSNVYAPFVPVTLIGPQGAVDVLALIDSGARGCLIQGEYAAQLGLNLLQGSRKTFQGLGGGTVQAYLHDIRVECNGSTFQIAAGFSNGPITFNILGGPFLDRVQLGLRENWGKIYINSTP